MGTKRALVLSLSLSLCVGALALPPGTAIARSRVPGSSGAAPDDVGTRLARAREERDGARAALRSSRQRLGRLHGQYAETAERLETAARDVVTAYRARLAAAARVAEAQSRIDRRAESAYETGPGIVLEFLLGARSPTDVASVTEFASRAFSVGAEEIARVRSTRTALQQLTRRLEARQDELRQTGRRLEVLSVRIAAEIERSREAARRARLEVETLEREHRRLEEQRRRLARQQAAAQATLDRVVDARQEADQSEPVGLLGPDEVRSCDVPAPLRLTGRTLSGQSSWYGPGFAGRPTASGAIYDPRLFTAANKDLPLGTFVRIRYRDRCAIVLVNDRGPFGVPGRIFDVSQAVAEHLGFIGSGVAQVAGDVLARD